MIIIKDLALNRYRFCAEKTRNDSKDYLWRKFKALLDSQVKEIGGEANTAQKSIGRKHSKKSHFVPILVSKNDKTHENAEGSDIVFFNKFYRTLVSGIYLDVYVLQQWVGVLSEIKTICQLLIKAQRLKKQLNDYDKIETELPAKSFCYFTEIPEFSSDPEFTSDPEKILSTLLGIKNASVVELDYAHFAIDFADEWTVAAIISKNFAEPEAKKKATKLFDVLLREYFLSVAKVDFATRNINNLDTESARQSLSNYFDRLKLNQPKTLSEIENANRDLTKYRVNLAEKIKTVEIHLHTIEINIGNAEKILDNPLLRQKKDALHRMLIAPLILQAEQIKVDITYFKIDEEKSKILGEEIANLSNLQAGIYGRKLAWLFGLFSLIGVLQLFPEFAGWKKIEQFNIELFVELVPRVSALLIVIIVSLLLLFGKDLKNGISRLFKNDEFQSVETKQSTRNGTARGKISPISTQNKTVQITKEKEL